MKNRAICIRCGHFKKDAFATCKSCNLTPKTDFEAARALILSEKTNYGDAVIGKGMEELQAISQAIQNGRPYPIDGEEQTQVVRTYYAYLKTLPPPKWYRRKKILALIAFILIALIAGIAYLLMTA